MNKSRVPLTLIAICGLVWVIIVASRANREKVSIAIKLAQQANTLDSNLTNLSVLRRVMGVSEESLVWEVERGPHGDTYFVTCRNATGGTIVWAFAVDLALQEVSTQMEWLFSEPDQNEDGNAVINRIVEKILDKSKIK